MNFKGSHFPKTKHNSANMVQHPKSKGNDLPEEARNEWDKTLRKNYWKERAKTELERRGLTN